MCYIASSLTPCHFYLSHILLVSYLSKISTSQATACCCWNTAGTLTLIPPKSMKIFPWNPDPDPIRIWIKAFVWSKAHSVMIPVNLSGILSAKKQAQNQIPACQSQTAQHKPFLTYMQNSEKASNITLLE